MQTRRHLRYALQRQRIDFADDDALALSFTDVLCCGMCASLFLFFLFSALIGARPETDRRGEPISPALVTWKGAFQPRGFASRPFELYWEGTSVEGGMVRAPFENFGFAFLAPPPGSKLQLKADLPSPGFLALRHLEIRREGKVTSHVALNTQRMAEIPAAEQGVVVAEVSFGSEVEVIWKIGQRP